MEAGGQQPPKPPPQGEPLDALQGFGSALVAAAEQAPPAGDPQVGIAFALGWHVAELHQRAGLERGRSGDPGLPGLGSLGDRERLEVLVDQVQSGIFKLGGALDTAGLARPEVGGLRESLWADPDDRRAAVEALHLKLLGVLTAADFRLGKAYGLARALADTCRDPVDAASLADELRPERIANLLRWLDDLSTALPPHAGHSVGSSLGRWLDWATNEKIDPDTVRVLRRQGELWRALLSGEKDGRQMLEPQNYLDAAGGVARRIRNLAVKAICKFWPLAFLVLGLFGVGLWLLIGRSGSGSFVAGAGTILASLGLTWKGLGTSLGRLAGRLEQPLWGAELDAAIANAITLLPKNKADLHRRRAIALEIPPEKRENGPSEDPPEVGSSPP